MAHNITLIIGQSGTGKTTHCLREARQAMRDGHGVFFLDTKGQAYRTLVHHVPQIRLKHTFLFDTSREEAFPFLNPLEDHKRASLAADLFLQTIKDLSGYSGVTSPVMDMYLFAVFASLAEAKEPLIGWRHMLTNKAYRARVLERVHNQEVLDLWNEYEDLKDKDQRQERSSSYNKAFILMANEAVRRVFSSTTSSFDRNAVVNYGVLLANLPQGQLSESRSSALASSLVSFLFQACQHRDTSLPFHFFLDNAEMLAPSLLISMVNTASSYNVRLTLSIQYINQLPRHCFDALIGNADHIITFKTSMDDSKHLTERVGSNLMSISFHELPHFTARQSPFSSTTESINVAPLSAPEYPDALKQLSFLEQSRGARTRQDAINAVADFYKGVGN